MLPSKSCKTINDNFLLKNFGLTFFDRFKTGTYLVNWFGRTLPNLQVRPIPMPMPIHRLFTNPNIIIFSRLGGWVQSTVQDDFIFEHGPRTIRPAGPQGANTLELIEELGLESKLKPIKYGQWFPELINF